MAANLGRNLLLKKGSSVIAGLRSKGMSFAGTPVDVTTDDEDGFRTLLAEAGDVSLDISFEGVTKDNVMRQAALVDNNLELTDITLTFPNGDTISGNFFLSGYEETGPYNEGVTFTGTLQSSGAWTYTPV